MAWLTIAQLLLKAVGTIFDYVKQHELIEAGEAKAIGESHRRTLELLAKLKRAKPGPIENDPDRRP